MPIWYGGDYNPEQWTPDVWDEDVRLMQRAGVTMATVGVFSWSRLEPREGEFDFGWLDEVLEKLHAGGIRVDMATATASPPPWLTHSYPEVLPVTESGVRLSAGSRQQYCPSSPVYRRLAARLVTAIVERYGAHPALELWHINNEYGCHVSRCYCGVSADAFRSWLRDKYVTVGALNRAWGTGFWSQQYGSFDEVYPPREAPTFRNPTQLLDFDRFGSDELLACYSAEAAIIRATTPAIPITTNFMGFFKDADYWRWAQHIDVISDDAYPDPADPAAPAYAAMSRDLMRSLAAGKQWILMEQSPSAVNWRERNAPKRSGQMRAWSMQALARGADGILFFQWRQSIAGAEKFHSAMLPHAGTESRVWREIEALGAELGQLETVLGGRVVARVAIVIDWDSWWSIEQPATPGAIDYIEGIFAWYRTLWYRNVAVDFVAAGADLSTYSLVIAPSLFVTTAEALASLDAFVRAGGHLLATFQSAIVDENARITAGGYLGVLQQTLGITIEEFAPLAGPDLAGVGGATPPTIELTSELFDTTAAVGALWSEVIHPTTATVVAEFGGAALDNNDLVGSAAITRNAADAGVGWYVATMPDDDSRHALLARILTDAGVVGMDAPPGVEIVRRGNVTFAINHGSASVTVTLDGADAVSGAAVGEITLEPQAVAIVRD